MEDLKYAGRHICLVSSQTHPHVGGVENYVANLSQTLLKMGCKVTVVTSSMEGFSSRYEENGITFFRLPSWQLMDGRFPVLKPSKLSRSLKKLFKDEKIDLMLVNMRFYLISLYAVRLAKKLNIPCVMLDHGSSHLNTGGKLTSWMGECFEHAITAMEKRYCKHFAGVSSTSLEWIQHFGIHSDLVLSNAVDVEKFDRLLKAPVRCYRKEYHIPEDAVLISFVGRMTYEKGIDKLVRVVDRILKSNPSVYLFAAGDGYLKEQLKDYTGEHIVFLGQIPTEEVVPLLSESDIFCLPSFSEGCPTCVLEASVCGTFCITTERGGAKDFISSEDYGVILPDNNEEGLYQAIVSVLNRPDYRKNAAKSCSEIVRKRYVWEQTATRLLELSETLKK